MPRARNKLLQATRDTSVSTTTTAKNRLTSEQPRPVYPPAVPPPVSPLVAQLRKDYRWASISQFLFSFGHALGVSDEEGDVEALEADLDAPVDDVLVPKLMVKLLYALTYDKKINADNFELKLRKQYVLRDPRRNPFGTDEEVSRRWNQLGLSEKIEAFYNCCEWLWDDPARFRALLNSEEDAVQWRIEPCGWDKDGNTYWLFDDNRLWVQHPDPTPPKLPTPVKEPPVKKANATTGRRKKGYVSPAEEEEVEQAQPQRGGRKARYKPVRHAAVEEAESEEEPADEEPPRKRGRVAPVKATTTRYGRTSKAVQQSAATPSTSRPEKLIKVYTSAETARPAGRSTRASRRSGIVGDQWEPIPEEWLQPKTVGKAANGKAKKGEKPTPEEEESELSELSDVAGEEESDLTSISSSTLSDVEGDDGTATGVGLGEGMNSGDAVTAEMEVVESVDKPTENGTSNGTPMDVDLSEPSPPSELTSAFDAVNRPTESAVSSGNQVSADVNGNQEESIVPSANVAEQEPTSEKNMADVNMEAAPTEAEEQAVGNGAAKSDEEQTNAQVKPDTSTAILEEPASSKPEPEINLPLQHESADSVPNNDTKLDQQMNGVDGKTVLQELSTEVAEALDEEEDDPKDEVRAIIKRARNPDYLEWELVCASRYEWEMFPKQFENSRNADEKAFYRHLVDNILPGVLAAHREKEIRRAQEEAVRNRKRSSRLVMKELEREAQQKEEERIRQLEERMQRVRDEEARREAEERERINRERGREERLREREERIREREERLRYREIEEIQLRERSEREPETRLRRRDLGLGGSMSRQNSQASEVPSRDLRTRGRRRENEASPEDWEVACEICNRHGWNIDEDRPIVSCELCERWQHIDCHDRFDKQQGLPPRKWSKIDFYCAECRQRLAEGRARALAAEEESKTNPLIKSPDVKNLVAADELQPGQPTSPTVHRSPRITIPAYAHGRSPVLSKAQPQLLPITASVQPPQPPTVPIIQGLPSAGPTMSLFSTTITEPTSAAVDVAIEPTRLEAPYVPSGTLVPSQNVAIPKPTVGLTSDHQETPSTAQQLSSALPPQSAVAVDQAEPAPQQSIPQELNAHSASKVVTM